MATSSRSRRDSLRLSDQDTIRFLSFYEGEPILWNPFLEQYRDREARAEASSRIAKALNVDGFGPEQVMIKFKNLRSSYCQELKKIALCEASGASRDQIYIPHLKWFPKMDSFLKPHVTSRSTFSSYIDPTVELGDSEQSDGNNWDLSSLNQGIEYSLHESDLTTTVKEEPQILKNNQRIVKKLKLDEATENHTHLSPSIGNNYSQHCLRDISSEEDTLDQFGKYLFSLIRALPRQKALSLQREIINLAIASNIENDYC